MQWDGWGDDGPRTQMVDGTGEGGDRLFGCGALFSFLSGERRDPAVVPASRLLGGGRPSVRRKGDFLFV